MILCSPVHHRIHDILAHHRVVGSRLVPAAGSVRVFPVRFSVVVIGHRLLKIGIFYIECVVVHHIHIHPDPVFVERLYHLLHLVDAHFPVIGIRAVGTLRHVIILRVISPVKLRRVKLCLVHRGVVITWQDLHMRHAKILDVVDARRKSVRVGRPCLCESEELSRAADPRRRIRRQIPHMQLIDHRVCGIRKRRSGIVLKSLRIRRPQIHDHTPVAVHAGRPRIEIHRLIRPGSDLDRVGVVHAVQIALFLTRPHALLTHCHRKRLREIVAVSLFVQIERNLRCRGRPHLESGLFLCVRGSQIPSIVRERLIKIA